jgi:hypothetical protein
MTLVCMPVVDLKRALSDDSGYGASAEHQSWSSPTIARYINPRPRAAMGSCKSTEYFEMIELRSMTLPVCAYPGCSKQVWVDANGSPTRHCGRSHRDAMKKKAPTNNGGAHSAAPYAVCKLANCHRPVFVSANGVPGYFCGKTHQAYVCSAPISSLRSCDDCLDKLSWRARVKYACCEVSHPSAFYTLTDLCS